MNTNFNINIFKGEKFEKERKIDDHGFSKSGNSSEKRGFNSERTKRGKG